MFAPDDPSPTICGNNLTVEAGPCDQRELEARGDVVVFETPELDAPLEITGPVGPVPTSPRASSCPIRRARLPVSSRATE